MSGYLIAGELLMASRSLGNLTVNMVMNTGSFTEGAGRAEAAVGRLNKAAQKQREELARLVGQIDPVVAEYDRIDKMEEKLRKHRKAGSLDQSDYDLYLGKLNEMRKGVEKTSIEFGKNGKSAKEMQFALRGLPAQFTDIAVSLQGGQNPLTVFLQQGGQIKDMFGGIGPAAKAMGGYVAGLVNPFTIAASAAGVLALAYYQGSEEADRYRNAILLTGNASGVTADQLSQMAKRLDDISGTQRNAAKAISEVASSAKFSADQIELVSLAAVNMEMATGKAISDTIDEFKKLSDEPSKAIAELNKTQNFLTQSVYEQITALEKQGKQQQAATLAVKAYSDAINERTTEITNNLGYIERAWKAVKDGATEAWDGILNIGRSDTDSDVLADLNSQIENLQTGLKSYRSLLESGVKSSGYGAGKVDYEALVKNQEKQLKTLISQRDELSIKVQTQEEEASKQAEFNKLQQEAIKASEAINKVRTDGLSTDEKRNKAVKEYLANVEKIRLANPESALLNPDQIKKDIKAIEESFKESNKAISDSASQQMIMRLREQEATLSKQLENNAKLGAAQQELVKFEQQIADLKEKKTLTAQQKSLIADQELIREQLNKNVAIEQELSLRDQAIRIQNMQASVTAQLSSDIERYQSSLANFGAGDETLKRLKEEQAIRNDINKQLERATSRNLAGKTSNEELEAEKRMLEQSLQDRLSAQGQYYEQLDKLESDWKNGAKAAFDNYIYEASRAAKISEGLFNSAFSAMEDAILQFALTGKASFKDFAAAVVKDIARIASQQAAAGLLSYGVSLFASAYAGSSSGASTGLNNGFGQNAYDNIGFSSGGYTGSGGKNQPAGIVHRGEVVWSQDDIAKAGGVGVVEAMRKGLLNYKEGLKGYANGGAVGLNVPAISSMSSNQSVIIQQQINIPESQSASGGTADDQMIAKAYAESAKAGAKDQIAKELMPGGMIWRAQNGR